MNFGYVTVNGVNSNVTGHGVRVIHNFVEYTSDFPECGTDNDNWKII